MKTGDLSWCVKCESACIKKIFHIFKDLKSAYQSALFPFYFLKAQALVLYDFEISSFQTCILKINKQELLAKYFYSWDIFKLSNLSFKTHARFQTPWRQLLPYHPLQFTRVRGDKKGEINKKMNIYLLFLLIRKCSKFSNIKNLSACHCSAKFNQKLLETLFKMRFLLLLRILSAMYALCKTRIHMLVLHSDSNLKQNCLLIPNQS